MTHSTSPGDGAGNGSTAVGGGTKGQSKTTLAILLALGLVVVVILAAIVLFGRGGSDSAKSADEAYVDDSGAQEHIPEPPFTDSDKLSSMTLAVGKAEAPVDFVEATEQGVLLPPTDVNRLGWYEQSAVPGAEGSVGSTVITGHINDVSQGEGFAAKFVNMNEGDTFTITLDGTEQRQFVVTEGPKHYGKGEELPEVVNDVDGENRVALVTCGGEFVGGVLGYADNIIVVGELVAN